MHGTINMKATHSLIHSYTQGYYIRQTDVNGNRIYECVEPACMNK